ncbi:MAG: hypothetical protein HYY65_13465 [Candidatus Tectomicrobia bacterium]|uniref:Uncharacterized protein n=1 Tax=Tectimicrobiota bacterium TaxID=2528274 RepID=A0A932GRG5_UNCTE|nr:hypothetical protein [Candidatus Tectomicrobia bacterium]
MPRQSKTADRLRFEQRLVLHQWLLDLFGVRSFERLTADLPDLLTEAVIAPVPMATVESEEEGPSKGVPMRRDNEVESIAMDVAMRYERSRGWPETHSLMSSHARK